MKFYFGFLFSHNCKYAYTCDRNRNVSKWKRESSTKENNNYYWLRLTEQKTLVINSIRQTKWTQQKYHRTRKRTRTQTEYCTKRKKAPKKHRIFYLIGPFSNRWESQNYDFTEKYSKLKPKWIELMDMRSRIYLIRHHRCGRLTFGCYCFCFLFFAFCSLPFALFILWYYNLFNEQTATK